MVSIGVKQHAVTVQEFVMVHRLLKAMTISVRSNRSNYFQAICAPHSERFGHQLKLDPVFSIDLYGRSDGLLLSTENFECLVTGVVHGGWVVSAPAAPQFV